MRESIAVDFYKRSPHGKRPEERSVEELLAAGTVNLDKPQGPTSHQVTAWVKDILEVKKAGHGGTLDPRVTGVLPIATGRATRALDALLEGDKEYVGVMRLHQDVSRSKLTEIISLFKGPIYQTPPLRAAVKRVRRVREIYDLELLEVEGRDVLFRVRCQSGTYVRTLCVDIGEALGVGAHLQDLRRTRTASFTEEESCTLLDLKDAYVFWVENGDEGIREFVKPMERLLDHLPKIYVKDTAVDALCHGADLAVPGVIEVRGEVHRGTRVALLTAKGEGIALAKAEMDPSEMESRDEGVAATLYRVLMEPGTYPRMWK